MSVNWIPVSPLNFNSMLLLERVQLGWFPGWLPEKELAIALHANPAVRWYFENKCPEIREWVKEVCKKFNPTMDSTQIRVAEETIMGSCNDLLTYAIDPAIYANQEFLTYPDSELLEITDFSGKIVLDLGSGTGRLAFITAKNGAETVYAVEPVANLREYIRKKAVEQNLPNVYAVDGLITQIPFADGFADVVMGGHVFGDAMAAELAECKRVLKSGGMLIFCPGSSRAESAQHQFLTENRFSSASFIEPPDLTVRKYWKTIK